MARALSPDIALDLIATHLNNSSLGWERATDIYTDIADKADEMTERGENPLEYLIQVGTAMGVKMD